MMLQFKNALFAFLKADCYETGQEPCNSGTDQRVVYLGSPTLEHSYLGVVEVGGAE